MKMVTLFPQLTLELPGFTKAIRNYSLSRRRPKSCRTRSVSISRQINK